VKKKKENKKNKEKQLQSVQEAPGACNLLGKRRGKKTSGTSQARNRGGLLKERRTRSVRTYESKRWGGTENGGRGRICQPERGVWGEEVLSCPRATGGDRSTIGAIVKKKKDEAFPPGGGKKGNVGWDHKIGRGGKKNKEGKKGGRAGLSFKKKTWWGEQKGDTTKQLGKRSLPPQVRTSIPREATAHPNSDQESGGWGLNKYMSQVEAIPGAKISGWKGRVRDEKLKGNAVKCPQGVESHQLRKGPCQGKILNHMCRKFGEAAIHRHGINRRKENCM